jgi:hypothetical protein
MATVSSYLEDLVRETRKSEAEVMAKAIEAGLRQLWREQVLGQYLRGQITRPKAVETVGADWVELAERQHQAMREDLEWAREQARSSSPTPDR